VAAETNHKMAVELPQEALEEQVAQVPVAQAELQELELVQQEEMAEQAQVVVVVEVHHQELIKLVTDMPHIHISVKIALEARAAMAATAQYIFTTKRRKINEIRNCT
jgi:hypothetical protein